MCIQCGIGLSRSVMRRQVWGRARLGLKRRLTDSLDSSAGDRSSRPRQQVDLDWQRSSASSISHQCVRTAQRTQLVFGMEANVTWRDSRPVKNKVNSPGNLTSNCGLCCFSSFSAHIIYSVYSYHVPLLFRIHFLLHWISLFTRKNR